MRVMKRRVIKKKIIRYGISILITLILSISFIGECTGINLLDNSSESDSTIIDEGKADSTYSEPSADSSEKEQLISTNDETSDSSDTTKTETTISNDNTVDKSYSKDDSYLIYTDNNTLIDTILNITETTNISQSSLNYLLDQIDINGNNLEYWLKKLNLTDIDEELKSRFLTLLEKTTFIEDFKIKIMNLLNDDTLKEEELKIRLLSYIRTVSLNEREVSVQEIASKVESTYDNIESGKIAQVFMNALNQDAGIEEVQFTAKRNLTSVKVSIIELKQKPEDIPHRLSTNKTVYQYLDIKLTSHEEYISDDDIETLSFTFKVDLSWISEKNIDKDTIILIRYHDGEWQNLSTILLSENETCITFEAESPGCSTFAVVGSTLVEIPEPYATETPEIPWMVIIGVITSTTIILVTVLFKARYIYFEEGPHKIKYMFFEGDPHKLKSKNNTTMKNNNFNRKPR